MPPRLNGFHHVTAITANAPSNLLFYRDLLGMRLVKKTVNQDDTSAYHLFYADGEGSPGTDITFFDWPAAPERRGSGSVCRTGLRIASEDSLDYWTARLRDAGHMTDGPGEIAGSPILDFEDQEGQRLRLIVDPDGPKGSTWAGSPVPEGHRIHGLGTVTLAVREYEPIDRLLTGAMGFERGETIEERENEVRSYRMGEGGSRCELQVVADRDLQPAGQGSGGVHHVAFRTPDRASLEDWTRRLREHRVPSSGEVERYYFRSLYFRTPCGILFEIATDGPGFDVDEPLDSLGETLALPPFLEPRRASIEAGLKTLEAI